MRYLALLLALAPAVTLAQEQCAGCHGANGEGNAQMHAPRIAGQPLEYLARQLEFYADGTRQNAMMTPIAKGLTPEQRGQLAQHYAKLSAPANKASGSAPGGRAAVLVSRGDQAKHVQACANCHGPGGAGVGVNPYLAGLDAGYLSATLAQWKSGARKTDPSGQMNVIARALADEDIKALASYFAGQPAPIARAGSEPARAGASSPPTREGVAREPAQNAGAGGSEAASGGGQGPASGQTAKPPAQQQQR
jgi:cytochrome c553